MSRHPKHRLRTSLHCSSCPLCDLYCHMVISACEQRTSSSMAGCCPKSTTTLLKWTILKGSDPYVLANTLLASPTRPVAAWTRNELLWTCDVCRSNVLTGMLTYWPAMQFTDLFRPPLSETMVFIVITWSLLCIALIGQVLLHRHSM